MHTLIKHELQVWNVAARRVERDSKRRVNRAGVRADLRRVGAAVDQEPHVNVVDGRHGDQRCLQL